MVLVMEALQTLGTIIAMLTLAAVGCGCFLHFIDIDKLNKETSEYDKDKSEDDKDNV